MPAYTIVKDAEILRVVRVPASKIDSQLSTGETYIEGAYPRRTYKIENNLPVQMSEAEISAYLDTTKFKIPTAENLIKNFAVDLNTSGLATQTSLPPHESWTKEDAKKAIDQAAGRARFRFMSVGTLLNEEYRLTAEQVKAWRDAGSPENDIPDTLQSWMNASGMTAEEAAKNIEATHVGFNAALAGIRDIRLLGKALIDAATEDYSSIAATVINDLETLVLES